MKRKGLRLMQPDDIPVACCLSSPQLREREATLIAEFKACVTAVEEIRGGYIFHLAGDGNRMKIICNLIEAERQCCPFLKFELTAQPNMGPLVLAITGPVGTKEFLKPIFL
jgi:hypothetical protein